MGSNDPIPEPLSDAWFDAQPLIYTIPEGQSLVGDISIDLSRERRQVAAAALRWAVSRIGWPDPDARDLSDEFNAKADEIEKGGSQ
jgi:hypothetical protein